MTNHTWLETLEKERRGNMVLDAIFDSEFIIVRATREHQRQKIDRFHIHKTDAMIIHRVDYKVDEKAGETNNLALENISVQREGETSVPGWIHTTIADLIVYYVPARERAYLIQTNVLRARWNEISGNGFHYKHSTTTHDFNNKPIRPYKTWNYLPTIKWLHENGFFEKVVDTNKLQLGLFL